MDFGPNSEIVEDWGGSEQRDIGGGEWDAINAAFGLRGKRRVGTPREAIEKSIQKKGAPYLWSDLRIDLLNETAMVRGSRTGRELLLPEPDESELAAMEAEFRADVEHGAQRGRPTRRKALAGVVVRSEGLVRDALERGQAMRGAGYPLSAYDCEIDTGTLGALPLGSCADPRAAGAPLRVVYRPDLDGWRPRVYLAPATLPVQEEETARGLRADVRAETDAESLRFGNPERLTGGARSATLVGMARGRKRDRSTGRFLKRRKAKRRSNPSGRKTNMAKRRRRTRRPSRRRRRRSNERALMVNPSHRLQIRRRPRRNPALSGMARFGSIAIASLAFAAAMLGLRRLVVGRPKSRKKLRKNLRMWNKIKPWVSIGIGLAAYFGFGMSKKWAPVGEAVLAAGLSKAAIDLAFPLVSSKRKKKKSKGTKGLDTELVEEEDDEDDDNGDEVGDDGGDDGDDDDDDEGDEDEDEDDDDGDDEDDDDEDDMGTELVEEEGDEDMAAAGFDDDDDDEENF